MGVLAAGLLALHLLAAVAWVGGIFFAYMALRPASMLLDAPQRLALWAATFGRFFPWVWGFIAVLLVSGHVLMTQAPTHGGLLAMAAIGWTMSLLFAYLYFVLFASLKHAVAASDTPAAAQAMARIRPVMAANLALGLAASALGALHPVLG
ncbi:MAG: CopD family protein [Thiobacillus sp.]|nr:CopD family protein [Thiobacillus sp.]